jgi:hypothetical protein
LRFDEVLLAVPGPSLVLSHFWIQETHDRIARQPGKRGALRARWLTGWHSSAGTPSDHISTGEGEFNRRCLREVPHDCCGCPARHRKAHSVSGLGWMIIPKLSNPIDRGRFHQNRTEPILAIREMTQKTVLRRAGPPHRHGSRDVMRPRQSTHVVDGSVVDGSPDPSTGSTEGLLFSTSWSGTPAKGRLDHCQKSKRRPGGRAHVVDGSPDPSTGSTEGLLFSTSWSGTPARGRLDH